MVSVLSSGRRRLMGIFHFLMCGGCYIKQLLLFTRPTAPFGRAVAVLCGGCYFFDARQKSNQKSAWGLRPSTPRRRGRRNCSPCRQGKAQRFGQVQSPPSCRRLSTKMELGERSNAQMRLANPSHIEKGEYGSKPFCQTEGDIHAPP